MEQSLFRSAFDTLPAPSPPSTGQATTTAIISPNDAVLQALIREGVGMKIVSDTSSGKREVLQKMIPRTRGLQKMLDGLDNSSDTFVIRGADNAVETLEFLIDIVNSKFHVANN